MDCVTEYGYLRCECQSHEKQPRKREIKGGRIVYGYQCQNCGRFEQKSMKSFGWNLPTEFMDESLSQSFSDRIQSHWKKQNEKRQNEWRAFYDSYMQSDAWRQKRAIVLDRDGYMCQSCLQRRASQVHHLSYKYLGREPLWDLVSVCAECHSLLHPHMQNQQLVEIDWKLFNTGS